MAKIKLNFQFLDLKSQDQNRPQNNRGQQNQENRNQHQGNSQNSPQNNQKPRWPMTKHEFKEKIIKKVQKIIADSGLSVTEIAKKLQVDRSLVIYWKNGSAKPCLHSAWKIKKEFGVNLLD